MIEVASRRSGRRVVSVRSYSRPRRLNRSSHETVRSTTQRWRRAVVDDRAMSVREFRNDDAG